MEQYQKRGYLQENFRLFHLRTQADTKVDYHYHEFCKLLFLVSGKGNYVVDGHRYLLQPGDVVLVGSRSVHCPELEADTPYERVILYISPEFLQQQSTPDGDLHSCFAGAFGHVLRLKEKERQQLFAQLTRLEEALNSREFGGSVLSQALLLRLLVQIGRFQRQTDIQHPKPAAPQNSRVLEIMGYMDAHLAEDLNVDLLAERFYGSKYHMMRLFRQETGFTVHTYLLQRRLFFARELIEKGMRATEACYRSGFRSYSSFTRAYGRYFGTTPTGRRDPLHEWEEGYE